MKPLTSFTPLVEFRCRRRMLATVMALALMSTSLIGHRVAHAQASSSKIAADLQQAIAAPTTPKLKWTKDLNGVRHVQMIVVGDGVDPEMTAVRQQVLRTVSRYP